jgi:hypothetical protein
MAPSLLGQGCAFLDWLPLGIGKKKVSERFAPGAGQVSDTPFGGLQEGEMLAAP